MLQFLARSHAGKGMFGTGMETGIASPQFVPCGRRIVHSPDVEDVSAVKQEIAELGLADVRCVPQHGLEYRLQFARGRTDDA